MQLKRVAVLGGGPGGLYAARLLKLYDPRCRVDLYEQGTPDATFGFGVGLAVGTLHNLQLADAASHDDILAAGWLHDSSMRVGDQVARMPNRSSRSIGRTTLLFLLQRQAAESGVVMHFGQRRWARTIDADLVIAADGVGSATRGEFGADFGAEIELGSGLYLWCGTDMALPSAMFMPVTTDAGTFVTHAYPYAADRSTFLIETDESTWRAAGFDVSTDATPHDQSDTTSLRYLQDAFSVPLEGHNLIGNRTRWLRFRTIACQRWHYRNIALLGDAAHTAHYSIGSGTKLAMEDAVALVSSIAGATRLTEALSAYEALRKPAVDHLQAVALRSQRWWDSFPRRTQLQVDRLLVAYMTRAGKVPLARFAESAPSVVRAALADYGGSASEPPASLDAETMATWVIQQPFAAASEIAPTRIAAKLDALDLEVTEVDAWGSKADGLVATALRAVGDGTGHVRVTGAGDRDSVLNRLNLAERLRLETSATVIVRAGADHRHDLVAGLVAGRTDLIDMTDHADEPREETT